MKREITGFLLWSVLAGLSAVLWAKAIEIWARIKGK